MATNNPVRPQVRKVPPWAGRKSERGVALIGALVACMVVMAIVLVMFRHTDSASRSVAVHENNAIALAAAEYGANRAIAEMTAWFRLDGNAGVDWVDGGDGSALYVDSSGNVAKDQRRFSGTFGDHEYRVLVRSARLAKEHKTREPDWLWEPEKGENIYEVVSSSRSKKLDTAGAEYAPTSTLQTVLNINLQDTITNGHDLGSVFLSDPANFQPHMGTNLLLSGEDHDINKYYIEKFESERIVTPLKLITNTANFFGALGTYWTSGWLTLNYRMEPDLPDPNPHRPRTPNFGTADTHRQMFVADVNREYDTYLLGGKQGKTVTVDMNVVRGGVKGYINETNTNQANQGGSFDIVLGAFEDLRNLYINMAGVVGSVTNPNDWFQMYVGQYTHSARNANGTVTASLPNYGGAKVRAQTVHMLKNQNEQFLVRLYKKGNTYYKYAESGSSWTGYYCWADATFSTSGLLLNKNVTASGDRPAEKKNGRAVARTFFWQELVGYQLVRRYERPAGTPSSDPYKYEPAIIQQRDLPPSGQKIDKRTIYRVDGSGERFPAGFDEIYQAASKGGVHGNTSNSYHPLRNLYGNDVTPGYLQDRFDSIYVRNADGTVTEHPDMNSFLFDKEFNTVDDNGNTVPVHRPALALFIAYEDQRETTADYNYTDMMFTIYIAPSVEQQIIPGAKFPLLTDQWWEQNPDNGLTGEAAHPGLVTNSDPSVADAPDQFKANYEALGYAPKGTPGASGPQPEDQVYTMKKPGSSDDTLFNRAQFAPNSFTGTLEFVPKLKDDGNPDMRPYYYTEDDVNNYYIHEWNKGNKTVATEEGRAVAKAAFLASFPPTYDIREMPERWTEPSTEQPVLSGDDAENSAYKVMVTTQSLRRIAADIFGHTYQMVPIVNTFEYKALTNQETGLPYEPVKGRLGYLAGEMVQDPANAELAAVKETVYDDELEINVEKPTYVEFRPRETEQPDGTKTPSRVFLDEDPAKVVEMAYKNFYSTKAEEREMQLIYGTKDKRHSLGFHRSGPDERFAERFSQDHYEVVMMGQLGFNPYTETVSGKRAIAKNTETNPNLPGAEEPNFTYSYKYGKAFNGVPQFIFDKPIDGAGILVINGDLVVKDEFAFYGLLLVLGDVVIIPTYDPKRLVYGLDGNPTDVYGNSLYKNNDDKWEYVWENPVDSSITKTSIIYLDENGNPKKDSQGQNMPVTPMYATGPDAYRGRLVTQGTLLVNGRIMTGQMDVDVSDTDVTGSWSETVNYPGISKPPQQGGGGTSPGGGGGTTRFTVTGQLNCYASTTAMNLANELAAIHKDIVDVVSWSSSTSNTVLQNDEIHLWNDEAE